MTINIYDLTNHANVHEKCISELLCHIEKAEQAVLDAINVIIASDAYLKDLNNRFLNKDRPTNVIAFPMHEVSEIYVSYEQCRDDSELYYYIAHGFLHVLGYEHDKQVDEKTMDTLCRKYVNAALPEVRL